MRKSARHQIAPVPFLVAVPSMQDAVQYIDIYSRVSSTRFSPRAY